MGREVMRVPLDFDWPLEKAWSGYLSPEWPLCADCKGRGYTAAYLWLETITHLLMMLGPQGAGLRRELHPWLAELPCAPDRAPGPEAYELTRALAGRDASFMGHDSIDQYSAAKKIIKAAGLDEKWPLCRTCGGHGYADEATEKLADAWERTDPPEGEGWQIWETVSEGSPITPVFPSPEALADWCVENAPWGQRMDHARWMKFINAGWAPSLVMDAGGGVRTGVEFVADRADEK